METVPQSDEQLRKEVSARYAQAALQVLGAPAERVGADPCGGPSDNHKGLSLRGCGPSCCTSNTGSGNPITSDLYTQIELGEIPVAAALASLGCGNPTALAELLPGEKVLDLGSGGGIDVLLSAKRVGPTGFAYGLDMTDAMLELADRNRREA